MPPKYSPRSVHDVAMMEGDDGSTQNPTTTPTTTTTINHDHQPARVDDGDNDFAHDHARRHPHSSDNDNYIPPPPPSLHHSHELLEVAIVRLLGSFRNYAGRHPDAVDMIENLPQATEFVSRFVAAYASTEGLHSVLDHRAAAGAAPSDNGQYRYPDGGAADENMMMSTSNRSNRSNPNQQQQEQYFSSSFEYDQQSRRRSPSPAYHQLQNQHPHNRYAGTSSSKKLGSSSSSHHGPMGTPPTAPLKSPSPHVKCRVPAANLHLPPNLHLSECLPRDAPMSPPLPRPSQTTSTPRTSQPRDTSAVAPGSARREEVTNTSFNSATTPRQQQLRTTPRRRANSKRSSSNPTTPQQGSLQQSDDADMSPDMVAKLISEVEASILAHDEGVIAMAANRLVMAANAAAVTAAVAASNADVSSHAANAALVPKTTTTTTSGSTSTTTAATGAVPSVFVYDSRSKAPTTPPPSASSSQQQQNQQYQQHVDDCTVSQSSQATTAHSSATPSPAPQITFSGGGGVNEEDMSGEGGQREVVAMAAPKSSPSAVSTATTVASAAPITFAGEERDFTTTTTTATKPPVPMKKPTAAPTPTPTPSTTTKNTTSTATPKSISSCQTISSSNLGAIATGAAESFLSKVNMDKEPAAARAVTTAKAAAAALEFDDDDLENDIPKLDVENIKFLINALKPLSTEVLEEICYEWGNLPAHGRRARRKYRLRGDRLRRQQLAAKFPTPSSTSVNSTTLPHLRSVSETKQEETEIFEGSDYYSSTTSKTTTDSFRFSQLSDFEGKEDIDMCTVSFSSLLDSDDSVMKRLRAPVAYNAYHDEEDYNYHLDYGFEDVDVVSEGSSEGVQRKGIIIVPKTGVIPTTAAERIKKRRAARKAAKESTMTKAEIRKTSKAKRERRDRRYFQEAIGQRIRFLAVNLLVTTCISFQRETGRKLLVSMDVEDSHEQQQIFTDAEIDDMLFSVCHILANDTRDSSLCVLASSFGLVNVSSVNRLPTFMPNLIICMGLLALLQPLPQLLLQRILVELNVHAAQKALLASAKETTTNANAKRGGMTRTQQRAQETAAAEAALQEARRLEFAIEPMPEESVAKAKAAAATLLQEGGGGYGDGDDDEDGCDAQDMPLLPMGGVEDVADDFKDKYCYPIATHVFPLIMKSPMLTDLKALPINSKLSVFESSPGNYSVQIASYVHTHFVDRQRLVSEPFTCKLYPMVEDKKVLGAGGGSSSSGKKGGGGTTTSSGAAGKKKGTSSSSTSTAITTTTAAAAGPSSSGVKGKLEKIKFRAETVISGSHVSFRIYHRAPPLSSSTSSTTNSKVTTSSADQTTTSSSRSRRALHVIATVMTNVKKGNNNQHNNSVSTSSAKASGGRGGKVGGGGGVTANTSASSKSSSSSVVMTKNAILYAGERLVFDDFIPADAAGGIDGAGCGAGGGAAARGAEFYDVSTDMLSFKLNLEILDDCTDVVAQNRLEVIESSTGTSPSLTNSPAPHSMIVTRGGGGGGLMRGNATPTSTADGCGDDEDDLPPLLLGADRTTSEVDGAVNNLMSKLQKSGGSGGGGSGGSSLSTTIGGTSATTAVGLGGSGSSSHVNNHHTSSENRRK